MSSVLELMLILQATVIIVLPQLIQADYVLEVRAHTYRNSRNRDSNGDCCDGFFSCGQCDNQFVFCLRGSSTSNDGNPNNCPLGRYSTGEIGDDSFTFGSPIASGVPNPMTFSGSVWPGTVRLFIEVEDADVFFDDHVDDVYVTITRNPNSSFSSRQAYTGVHGNSRIELSFRVQCTANFYGSNCATHCVARDDSGGHYRCGSNGERICLSGWSELASDCTTAVCSSGCHPVGGYCNSPGQCLCRSGWSGLNCDTCSPQQGCSSLGGYCNVPDECICHPGYSGSNCDVDLLPCERRSPCQNGATCTNDGRGGYTCSCPPGYEGTNCQGEINECLPNPCQNQGTCTDLFDDYECMCGEGFFGHRCENTVDPCLPRPCQNGATCTVSNNGYQCTCPEEFDGENCEIDMNICRSSPCLNGGTCSNSLSTFKCTCAPGFNGSTCELKTISDAEAGQQGASDALGGGGIAAFVGGGLAAVFFIVLIVVIAILVVVVCMKKRKTNVNDPPMCTYDNATDNPAYGLNIPNGSSTFPKSAAKSEEEPYPLYEELDINLDDSPYTFMKPVSILAPTTFPGDVEKADLSKGAETAKEEACDYDIPKSISENPYEI